MERLKTMVRDMLKTLWVPLVVFVMIVDSEI